MNENRELTQEELAEQLYQIWHISLNQAFVPWDEFRKSNRAESDAWALVAKMAISLTHGNP